MKKKIKICFITSADSIHSKRWVQYFASKGHKTFWISLGVEPSQMIKDNTNYYLKKNRIRFLRPLSYIYNVRKLLKKINPDILHVHQVWIDGIIGAFSGFHPFIITPWGSDILLNSKFIFKRFFIKYALSKTDLITCDAEHMKLELIKLRVDEKKIRIIYFGTDVDKFRPKDNKDESKEKLGLLDQQVLISLRGLKQIYDVQTLIKAIPYVLNKKNDIKLLIVGNGPEENNLKKLTYSLKLSDYIVFLGIIQNEYLPDYLSTADIYISTSLSDAGLAASTAEAMSCGLPVIVTSSGENYLWVKDGLGGFIVPPSDPKKLAEKILFIIENKTLRKKFGIYNRKVIVERNNYFVEMDKVEHIYISLSN